MFSSLLLTTALAEVTSAAYILSDSYTASNFFSKFNFYTGSDPTDGYVDYVSEATAEAGGLISTANNQIYIGVDHTNVASGAGRESVRLESKASYTHGIFILNLAHMPGSVCGTWPAFWMYGPDWPNNGEIDIIEGVNTNNVNAMTLHTSDGCSIENTGDFTGVLTTDNCYIYAAGQSSNSGCDIQDPRTDSYGDGFNAAGGGVFATEWTSDAINIWYFNVNSIPGDITRGDPNPSGWGEPVAQFEGNCDIDSHFANMNIVFDITFCGDWAGAVFESDSTCASLSSSCNSYVQNAPGAFAPTYWLINSLNVYESDGTTHTAAIDFKSSNSTTPINGNQQAPLGNNVPLAMGGGRDDHEKRSTTTTRGMRMPFMRRRE